ncbi:MAG: GHKL domain-containing protein [Agarilytica sp.]
MGFWSIELFILSAVKDPLYLDILFHLTRWGMFLIPPCLMLLTWSIIGRNSITYLYSAVIPGFVFGAALCATNFFVLPSVLEPVDNGFQPKPDLIYTLFSVSFVLSLLSCIGLGAVRYKQATFREKQKTKWLLIVLVVTLALGLLSMQLIHYPFYLKLVGASINMVFIGLLFYVSIHNNLMDFRSALSVSISRGILLSVFMWIFFLFASLSGSLDKGPGGLIVLAGLMIVMMELYPRLLKWILPNAKRMIAKNSYDYDSVTEDTAVALKECTSYRSLDKVCGYLFLKVLKLKNYRLVTENYDTLRRSFGEKDLETLEHFFQSSTGVVFADESPAEVAKIFRENAMETGVCIKLNDKSVGLLMLGQPDRANHYRYDDIKIFEWLGAELGRVISRIQRLDDMYSQLGQAKKTLSMLGVMNHYHHDIKAPLSIIDGVLSNNVYDKEKQKDIVLEQVERGSRLITTMANILKGERKRRVKPVSLREVVDDSVFLFSQGVDELHIQLDEAPSLMADAEDLKILVINVIKNAVEARRDGADLEIKIAAQHTASHIELTISDTGKGIPAHVLENLWDEVESDKEGGSGIGTQAIKRIADEHFADIEVNSELNVGTEFRFKFPLTLIVDTEETISGEEDRSAATAASSIAVNNKL